MMQNFIETMLPMIILTIVGFIIYFVVMWKVCRSKPMAKMAVVNYIANFERIKISKVAEQMDVSENEVISSIKWVQKTMGAGLAIEGDEVVCFDVRATKEQPSSTVVYLVVCPACSHKNIQGKTECENCGSPL